MNILIDMPVYEPLLASLQAIGGLSIDVLSEPAVSSRPLPDEQIRDCDVLFCTVPPANHAEMRNLKMIQISSAGYTQLIGQRFEERGVKACNALGVFDVPIGEWNMAMMINLARNLRQMIRNQETQVWDRSAQFQTEIRGGVVGIWGYGGIGRETARLAKAMGMQVHVLSRSDVQKRENIYCVPGTGDAEGTLADKVFGYDDKETFLKGLDFLIMAIPQTGNTEGIVGEEELRLLKPTAFLLNPARGPLIKEAALIKALQENWFAGAALDTHYYYPMPEDHPLWRMQNVILTPHISGSSASPHFLERTWDIFYRNVQRLQNGAPLLNVLTPSALKGN
ncbi:MAG: D-2-hydroxyacid dehydrogenase [Chitinophagaceae bacterium]|nr:MAG: D-2-hydroxyacid dehydrogenase [Chitinophagaceae bacterium]